MECDSECLEDLPFGENNLEEKSTYSNENTEDSLLSSKASSQSIIREDQLTCCPREEIRRKCRGPKFKIITGSVLFLWGLSTLIWTPFEIMMSERRKMRPGFPPYQWWKNPPDEVLLRVYIFNITNVDAFINGEDTKLNLQEIGPIVYREKLTHTNITFNDNDTMTYVATRRAIYLPEENTIDLNQTVIVPNLAVLGMASHFWDAPFFEKWAFNMLVRSADSNVTITTTINDYLWNFSDPMVELAKSIVPSMVPVTNLGILSRIYADFQDEVTVYIGSEHGDEKYFLIDKYDGSKHLPGYEDSCEDSLLNTTEGVAYPQFLTRNSTLRYWRKTMCRVTPLFFDRELSMKTVKVSIL